MKIYLKLLACIAIMSFASEGYSEVYGSLDTTFESPEIGYHYEQKGHCCANRARERALEINAAIDQTFPLLVPPTSEQGALAFASFFADNGIFQSPGGTLIGRLAIFAGFKAYGDDPGEINQHVVTRNAYWDARRATLTVERTWYATLTESRDFGTTTLPAGTTYSQDDAVIIRFACDLSCNGGCVLPGQVVYYREYFDPTQFQSIYNGSYPAPCNSIIK